MQIFEVSVKYTTFVSTLLLVEGCDQKLGRDKGLDVGNDAQTYRLLITILDREACLVLTVSYNKNIWNNYAKLSSLLKPQKLSSLKLYHEWERGVMLVNLKVHTFLSK